MDPSVNPVASDELTRVFVSGETGLAVQQAG
jgi:hypothetical protein